MRVLKKFVYLIVALLFAGFLITCTQIEFPEEDEGGEPVITLLGPNPYILNIGDDYLVEPGATAYDEVDGDLTDDIIIDKTPDQISTIIVGEQYVNYSVTDDDGKIGLARRTIKIQDSQGSDFTKPVITLKGDNPAYVSVGGSYSDAGADAVDDVDGNITSDIKIYGTSINTSSADTFTVWYMVEDVAGNVAHATRTVIVSGADTEPPVITLNGPNPTNLDVGYTYTELGATAIDNVDGDLSSDIVIDNSDVNTNQTGIYKVYYTVSDKAGNEAQKIRNVNVGNVSDTVPPVITLKGNNPDTADVKVSYNDPGAEALDNVDGDITDDIVETGNVDVNTFGEYSLKYNVSDEAGNAADEKTRTVWVVDRTKPVITLNNPNPVNIQIGNTYNEPGATATDNYDGDITGKIDTNASDVNTSQAGTYSVIYTVSDNAGNQAQETRTVNVSSEPDSIKPVITLTGNNPYTMKKGDTYNEPGYSATDDPDGDITSSVVVTDNIDNTTVGQYWVRYNVSDQAGNAADQKERTVNVTDDNDVTKPVITLEGANPYTMYIGDTYNEPGFGANDNVDGDITSKVQTTNNINNSTAGSYWVRYNVSDNAGNAADQKERTVVVNELSSDLIWEDFEVGENSQTKLAMDHFTTNDGWWYGYDDSEDGGESTIDPDPAVDTSFLQIVQTGNGYNSSKGLYVKFTLKKGATFLYPFSAFGFSIKVTNAYYNMSKMQEFKFRVKGSGQMRVQFETKMVKEWPNADERWGHFGKVFVLSSSWTEITLTPSGITPALYSEQADQLKKWTDPDAGDKVTAIVFQTEGVDGSVIEFYLDEIKTTGMTVQDLGK